MEELSKTLKIVSDSHRNIVANEKTHPALGKEEFKKVDMVLKLNDSIIIFFCSINKNLERSN